MSKHRQGGRQKSRGGKAGGGSNKQGKILYNSGEEPAFIRQFKERTGYQAPITTDDKRRVMINDIHDPDERPRDGDYRTDDERPQIVQLNASDLSKDEVDIELAKAREAEEEKKCVDDTGRLLFRKPKDKPEESDAPPVKSNVVEMASNKATKRKPATSSSTKEDEQGSSSEKKKSKLQLLSFMDEGGFDGDD